MGVNPNHFVHGDITFDLGLQNPPAINHGYTKVQGDVLDDDTLIKMGDAASKLLDKLTNGLQVLSYNPDDMKEKNNFFVFVSQWESVLLDGNAS